jgi:hypothetical protein
MKSFEHVTLGIWFAAAAAGAIACKNVESLGTTDHEQSLDGGSGGAAPENTGGSRSDTGGAPASGGTSASGGRVDGTGGATGGAPASGGASATGGSGGGCDRNCAPLPPECPPGEVLGSTPENCCVRCIPAPPGAACIIGGVRYEHLEVVKRQGCSTCLCVDGEIGRCTGACLPDQPPSGPELPLPTCETGQELIGVCNECGPADECLAVDFECRTIVDCGAGGSEPCGTGEICVRSACISGIPLCG